MPRTSSNTPDRDEEGRFTSDDQGAQTRNRDDDADDNRSSRAAGGQGRGWYGDSEGHAEAGSHSHDNSRGASRSPSYSDDNDRRGGNRGRDEEGRFARSSHASAHDAEADYGDWHAYGHARGYHGYQRRGGSQAGNHQGSNNQNNQGRGWYGDSQGHAEAGSHSHDNERGTSRSRSPDDNNDNRGGNRQRDEEGRFSGGNRH